MENNKSISFTKVSLPFGWLGNMSPFPILYQGKEWRNTEALFQALRFDDDSLKELVRAEKSPMGAKLKAKGMSDKMVIKQLSEEDVENMRLCINLKIEQHPHLQKELIETGDLPIYEDVTKRGNKGSNLFWGAMLIEEKWVGQNMLGKIWMEVRNKLRLEDYELEFCDKCFQMTNQLNGVCFKCSGLPE
jgi:predicted NAD-dependent protein-ADP-ribosyltransferase YbiA (DUF1768 family)